MNFIKQNLLLPLIFLLGIGTHAQQTSHWNVSVDEMNAYREQAGMLVKFFEGTLNFLGDPSSTVQEKEIIINESFAKIFVNAEVQIEDDLDDHRDVPINKDVRAYLKDVDFFFHSANFRFDLQNIESLVNNEGDIYFKITLNRKLNGKSFSGDSISSSRLRYMEINLDPFKKDLRIASYYTTKLNEKEELRNWWASLSSEWRNFFGNDAVIYDSLKMSNILNILDDRLVVQMPYPHYRKGFYFVIGKDTLPESKRDILSGRRPDTLLELNDIIYLQKIDTIKVSVAEADNRLRQFHMLKTVDISGKNEFTDAQPLSQLSMLEEINLSNTKIHNLIPLRNLNKLRVLNISGTRVADLTPLQYSGNLKDLNCDNTPIINIETIANFRMLEKFSARQTKISNLMALQEIKTLTVLHLSGTDITDLSPLAALESLRVLDISNTAIDQIQTLSGLSNLQQLNLNDTQVTSIEELSQLKSLNLVQFSNTAVGDLSPLQELPDLKRIYCDNSSVSAVMASAFMRSNPKVLVIFDSEELLSWWERLPIYWRALFLEQTSISSKPGTEELHQLINTPRLDLSGNRYLLEMQAINRMINLKELSISNTEINDLTPLIGLSNLRKLDISNTRIENLTALSGLFQLQELDIRNTAVKSLSELKTINSLQLITADGSQLDNAAVIELKKVQDQVLVIYQTKVLQIWWTNLDEKWKQILGDNLVWESILSPSQLQRIADRKELSIKNEPEISHLEPLMPLLFLEKLELSGTRVTDISPLAQLQQLRHLDLSGNPLNNIQALESLQSLDFLSIENTPIADISVLAGLATLKNLNLGGTQIRNIKPLAPLSQLEELSVYNTKVKNIQPIEKLNNLRHIKCYNTRISRRNIEKLRAQRPELNILYY